MSRHGFKHQPVATMRVQLLLAGILFMVGVTLYFIFVGPAKRTPRDHKRTNAPTKRSSSTGSSWSGGGSFGRRRVRKARPNRTPTRKIADAGTDGIIPENPSRETPPEGTKKQSQDLWLKGKVLVLPDRTPLQSFSVRYARSDQKGSLWGSQTLSVPKMPSSSKTVLVKDANGAFDIKVKSGKYLVQIVAKGYKPSLPVIGRTQPVGSAFRRTFALLRSGSGLIKGRVVSGLAKKPLAGVRVVCLPAGGSRWGWSMVRFGRRPPSASQITTTGEDGRFTFRKLSAGGYGLVIHAKGHSSWSRRGIRISDVGFQDLGDIVLNNEVGGVKGKVFGSDGKPVQGASVSGFIRGGGKSHTSFSRTNAAGEYALHNFPGGSMRLFVTHGKQGARERKMLSLKIIVGKVITKDIYFASTEGTTIKGVVTDANGAPVPKALIRVSSLSNSWRSGKYVSRSTVADDTGTYTINGIPKGRYGVSVTVKGRSSNGGVVEVAETGARHDIRLLGGGLSLTIVDKLTQKPPKDWAIAFLSWGDKGRQRLSQRAKSTGKIHFENLPETSMKLVVYSTGYSTWTNANITPPSPPEVKDIKVELVSAGRFLLKLSTPDNKAPSYTMVQLLSHGKHQWIPTYVQSSGELLIRSLPVGTAQIKIVPSGYEPLEVTIDVPAKGTGQASYQLTPKASKETKNTDGIH